MRRPLRALFRFPRAAALLRRGLASRLALFALCALAAAPAAAATALEAASKNTHLVLFKEGFGSGKGRKVAQAAGAKIVGELPFIGAIIVELPAFSPNAVHTLRADPSVETIEENVYRKWIEVAAPGWDSAAREAAPWGAASPLIRQAQDLGERIETQAPGEGQGPAEPGQAPGPKPPTNERPWGIDRVKAPEAWSRTKGAGVKVAIIDTGIDPKHPDLATNVKGGYNAVKPEEPFDDDNGHGTHVAGTIGAKLGNGGVAGVAPEASLYGVKVLDGEGGGTPATIVGGIAWAAENGMQVVNMSLGGPSSAAMRRAVTAAVKAGVTVVAASGNDPKAPVSAPARYPEVLAVSASDSEDKVAFFSTVGPEIDFIAPGHEVWSDSPGRRLARHSGTSMASPHVAGLAALAVSLGAKSPAQVRAALQKAATPLPGLTAEQQGAGMIEADRLATK